MYRDDLIRFQTKKKKCLQLLNLLAIDRSMGLHCNVPVSHSQFAHIRWTRSMPIVRERFLAEDDGTQVRNRMETDLWRRLH